MRTDRLRCVALAVASLVVAAAALDVINVATGHVLNSTPVLDIYQPTSLALSPDGVHLYVAMAANATPPGKLVTFDAITLQSMGSVAVGRAPADIALSPDGTRADVVNAGSNDVTVVALDARQIVATVARGAPLLDLFEDGALFVRLDRHLRPRAVRVPHELDEVVTSH